MKRINLTLIALSSFVFVNAQDIDVLHYKFNVELNDNNDTVKGLAGIHLKFLQPVKEFTLDFTSVKNDGKGMKTGKINGPWTKEYIPAGEKLRIILSQTAKPGDTATYFISYSGIPADGLIIAKNKYGNRTFFSDNWPNRAHNWLPCVDQPADKAGVEFIITAPNHYQVVSNGIQLEETDLPGNIKLTQWKEEVPLPTKIMVIGVAEF